MDSLQHTKNIEQMLADGNVELAQKTHNARVDEQLKRAQEGETINLSDLLAAREAFMIHDIENGS